MIEGEEILGRGGQIALTLGDEVKTVKRRVYRSKEATRPVAHEVKFGEELPQNWYSLRIGTPVAIQLPSERRTGVDYVYGRVFEPFGEHAKGLERTNEKVGIPGIRAAFDQFQIVGEGKLLVAKYMVERPKVLFMLQSRMDKKELPKKITTEAVANGRSPFYTVTQGGTILTMRKFLNTQRIAEAKPA